MLFEKITLIDENFDVKENMFVATEKDKIAYISQLPPQKDYGQKICGKNKLLTNGWFNCHTHLPMTLLRGYAENLKLQDWLNTKVFPFEAKMNEEDVYYAALLGIAEMFRFGTVSATEMYFHPLSILEAAKKAGIKLNLCTGTTEFGDGGLKDNKNFNEELDLHERCSKMGNDKIKADFSLHSEYITTEKIVKELGEYLKGKNERVHVHVSETKKETDECIARHGLTPTAYLEKCGIMNAKVNAAHSVWLTDEDLSIYKANGVTAVHNPMSNLKLGSGFARIEKMLEMGINVALGTDGVASNNNFNLFEDLRFAAIMHNPLNENYSVINPKTLVKMGTLNGAYSQDRCDCGCIKEGNKADFAIYDLNEVSMKPCHNLLNSFVYSMPGGAVLMTVVDGEIVYGNGKFTTIDIDDVIRKTEQSRKRILSEI
ncbi:MAG: amidohydrolase [Clostridia bacterium]|nr:amidohydrolase [Clostridia bacterium]